MVDAGTVVVLAFVKARTKTTTKAIAMAMLLFFFAMEVTEPSAMLLFSAI